MEDDIKNLKVPADRILVKRDATQEDGNVLMPHDVKKKPSSGLVLAIGKKVDEVSVGDRIHFNEYSGYYLKTTQDLEESDLIVMREDEVLVFEPAQTDTDQSSE